ncbi:hypothetical protein ORS3428_22215 [Mesorhizobium sp. ORS 3428]|nr:hypothetical protein ORS3428_22215 [Mesorhizobium sp. ORS 3428]
MTVANDQLLESKMTKVEQARAWSPRVISKFEALIKSADDHSIASIRWPLFATGQSPSLKQSTSSFMLPAVACST